MKKEEVKIGDVVVLNSGGPKMTVVKSHEDGTFLCVWMIGGTAQNHGWFPPEALRAGGPGDG